VLFCQDSLLHRLGRNADDLVRSQFCADISSFHIALSHMDAICVHLNSKLHIIIDNKGNMILTAEFLQIFGFLKKMLLIQLFFPELNEGHTA